MQVHDEIILEGPAEHAEKAMTAHSVQGLPQCWRRSNLLLQQPLQAAELLQATMKAPFKDRDSARQTSRRLSKFGAGSTGV